MSEKNSQVGDFVRGARYRYTKRGIQAMSQIMSEAEAKKQRFIATSTLHLRREVPGSFSFLASDGRYERVPEGEV